MENNENNNLKNDDNNNEKKIKEWHPQHHTILKEWAEIGYSYRYLHDKAYLHYSKQNLKFALPVIVISTLTGTANFAQQSFPKEWQTTTPLIIGTFNLVAGLITTIAQFLRVSELLEGNRSASIGYDKFSRNIAVELSLPIRERELSGSEFISKCRLELDKLIEQSPNIPQKILKQFAKKFENKSFFKPNILDINPIKIYVDDGHEQLKALKIIQKEKQIINKIKEEEEKLKNKLIKKIKEEEEETKKKIKNEFEKHKFKKKQKISSRSVTKNLDKLLINMKKVGNNGPLTPDTSDLDSSNDERINEHIDKNIISKPAEILNNISIIIKEEENNNKVANIAGEIADNIGKSFDNVNIIANKNMEKLKQIQSTASNKIKPIESKLKKPGSYIVKINDISNN